MRICIVTPARAGSRAGNRVTALRWSGILRELGHRVAVRQQYQGEQCDVMVSLHARRSSASVARFRDARPDSPLVVALTGTDLYGDIHSSPSAQRSLQLASRLVMLQPHGRRQLPGRLRAKVCVIYQSARRPASTARPLKHVFEVCVIGHLRPVKDPFRVALAVRGLPPSSRIRIVHIGAALSGPMADRARREAASNRRYRWLGEMPHWKARKMLARARMLVVSSKLEGAPNVASEALAASVPMISTKISGMVGLLGENYPGYFPVGETADLTSLLHRAETDARFYRSLKQGCRRAKPLVDRRREKESWRRLLKQLADAR